MVFGEYNIEISSKMQKMGGHTTLQRGSFLIGLIDMFQGVILIIVGITLVINPGFNIPNLNPIIPNLPLPVIPSVDYLHSSSNLSPLLLSNPAPAPPLTPPLSPTNSGNMSLLAPVNPVSVPSSLDSLNPANVSSLVPTNHENVPLLTPTNFGIGPSLGPTNPVKIPSSVPTNPGEIPSSIPNNIGEIPSPIPNNPGNVTSLVSTIHPYNVSSLSSINPENVLAVASEVAGKGISLASEVVERGASLSSTFAGNLLSMVATMFGNIPLTEILNIARITFLVVGSLLLLLSAGLMIGTHLESTLLICLWLIPNCFIIGVAGFGTVICSFTFLYLLAVLLSLCFLIRAFQCWIVIELIFNIFAKSHDSYKTQEIQNISI